MALFTEDAHLGRQGASRYAATFGPPVKDGEAIREMFVEIHPAAGALCSERAFSDL